MGRRKKKKKCKGTNEIKKRTQERKSEVRCKGGSVIKVLSNKDEKVDWKERENNIQ